MLHNDRGSEGLCVCAWLYEIGFLLRWEADFLIFGAHADFLSDLFVPVRRFGRSGRQVLSGGLAMFDEDPDCVQVHSIYESKMKRTGETVSRLQSKARPCNEFVK